MSQTELRIGMPALKPMLFKTLNQIKQNKQTNTDYLKYIISLNVFKHQWRWTIPGLWMDIFSQNLKYKCSEKAFTIINHVYI